MKFKRRKKHSNMLQHRNRQQSWYGSPEQERYVADQMKELAGREPDPEDEIGEPQEWKPEQLRYLEPCYKCKVKPILSYVDAEHCIRDHLPHYVVTCPVCGRSIRSDDPVGTWNIDQYWKSE